MGVCTFFDKSMKVLSSILAMATAQWDGFNYDDYSDVGKNQISQSSVNDVAGLNGQGGAVLSAYQAANHYLGNGLKCFYCNERSVGDRFTKSTFSCAKVKNTSASSTSAERSLTFSIDVRSTLITLPQLTMTCSLLGLPMRLST